MKRIQGWIEQNGSWFGTRQGYANASPTIVEVHYNMSQSKLYAVFADGDTTAEVITKLNKALAELGGKPAAGGATPGPTGKEKKDAKTNGGSAPAGGPTLDDVMKALTALKDTIDEKEGAEKKLGLKAVKKVLKGFGVTTSTDLAADKYAACIKAAQEATPEAEEDTSEEF